MKTNLPKQSFYRETRLGRLHRQLDMTRLRRRAKHRSFAGRLTAVEKAYAVQRRQQRQRYGEAAPCPLCDTENRRVIFESSTMRVVENDFPYYVFDGIVVKSHLMLMPQRHIAGLHELNAQEAADYWALLLKLSGLGYDSMTRSTGSHRRSVPGHVHTHMIKLVST